MERKITDMEIGYYINSLPLKERQHLIESYNAEDSQRTFEEFMIENYGRLIEEYGASNVITESAPISLSGVHNHARTLLLHMLKYKFQRNKQGSSWINSILSEHLMLCEGLSQGGNFVNEVVNNYNDIYEDAVMLAQKAVGKNVIIPHEIQLDMTYDKIINIDSILNFLNTYKYNQEAIDYLNGGNKGYYKNLSEINNSDKYRKFRIQTYGKVVK